MPEETTINTRIIGTGPTNPQLELAKNVYTKPIRRTCWYFQEEGPCPFSFEHTKLLLVNGCLFADDPTEFASLLCKGCLDLIRKHQQEAPPPQPAPASPLTIFQVPIDPNAEPPKKETKDPKKGHRYI